MNDNDPVSTFRTRSSAVINIQDLRFSKLLSEDAIAEKVRSLAARINADYPDRSPIFLPVLNGAFMFASDLIKEITIPCKVSFVKLSSYNGAQSTGQLKTLIGQNESLFNQDIIIVEDIVDSGLTLEKVMGELTGLGARSVEAAALLRKKPAREKGTNVRYVGFELDDEFVLGYGLDYNGLGRNLKDLYKKVD